MASIIQFLLSIGVPARLDIVGNNYIIIVEGKRAITHLFTNYILPLQIFWFWRVSQLHVMQQLVKYFALSTKYFLQAQIAMLTIIYAVPNVRNSPLEYWIDIILVINNHFASHLPSGHLYISTYHRSGGGWVVTLPSNFNIRPTQKYFTVLRYGTLELAFLAAIKYRDQQLLSVVQDNFSL